MTVKKQTQKDKQFIPIICLTTFSSPPLKFVLLFQNIPLDTLTCMKGLLRRSNVLCILIYCRVLFIFRPFCSFLLTLYLFLRLCLILAFLPCSTACRSSLCLIWSHCSSFYLDYVAVLGAGTWGRWWTGSPGGWAEWSTPPGQSTRETGRMESGILETNSKVVRFAKKDCSMNFGALALLCF